MRSPVICGGGTLVVFDSGTKRTLGLDPFRDGFSIGSNDLTQLILGVDRDSQLLAHLFEERRRLV